MLYQLPNGKVIEISLEQYLRMSDEEIHELSTYNFGGYIHNPFSLSVLNNGYIGPEIEETEEVDDFADEEVETLIDVDPEEKLNDEDYIDDNIET